MTCAFLSGHILKNDPFACLIRDFVGCESKDSFLPLDAIAFNLAINYLGGAVGTEIYSF